MLHSAVGSRKLADLVKDKGGDRTCIELKLWAVGRIRRSMLGNPREGLKSKIVSGLHTEEWEGMRGVHLLQ